MSDLRFYGQGKLMLPPGVTSKGQNFLRKGDRVPDSALKAMGQKKVEAMVAAGSLSTRDFYDGKPDAGPVPQVGGDAPRGRGRPAKAAAEPDSAPGGVGPKEE